MFASGQTRGRSPEPRPSACSPYRIPLLIPSTHHAQAPGGGDGALVITCPKGVLTHEGGGWVTLTYLPPSLAGPRRACADAGIALAGGHSIDNPAPGPARPPIRRGPFLLFVI